jgi:hypothetical protein
LNTFYVLTFWHFLNFVNIYNLNFRTILNKLDYCFIAYINLETDLNQSCIIWLILGFQLGQYHKLPILTFQMFQVMIISPTWGVKGWQINPNAKDFCQFFCNIRESCARGFCQAYSKSPLKLDRMERKSKWHTIKGYKPNRPTNSNINGTEDLQTNLNIHFDNTPLWYITELRGHLTRGDKHRCLIHNAHLRKIQSFCKILDPKITNLTKIFDNIFCYISAIVIQAWHSKVKIISLIQKIYAFHTRKFPKLTSETQVSLVNEAPGPIGSTNSNDTRNWKKFISTKYWNF